MQLMLTKEDNNFYMNDDEMFVAYLFIFLVSLLQNNNKVKIFVQNNYCIYVIRIDSSIYWRNKCWKIIIIKNCPFHINVHVHTYNYYLGMYFIVVAFNRGFDLLVCVFYFPAQLSDTVFANETDTKAISAKKTDS